MFGFGSKNSEGIDLSVLDVKAYRSVEPFRTDDLDTPTRAEAMQYVPFARSVTFIANQVSDLISTSLRVVDMDGKRVSTEQSKKAVDMLTKSPNGVQSGKEFVRECMFDYLVLGNTVVHVERTMGSDKLLRLTRMDASNTRIMIGKQELGLRGLVYHVTPMGFHGTMILPVSKIIHSRLVPQSDYFLNESERQFMSDSPLRLLKKAILIGKYADNWVADFFNSAAKANMAIEFPEKMPKDLQEKQAKAYEKSVVNKRAPFLVFGGATIKEMNPNPENAEALELRRFGVEEIGRFYGLPSPILGLQVSQWGSGIEQLAKLAYRYGVKPHLEVMLDAFGHRMLPMGQKFEVESLHELKGDIAAMVSMVDTLKPTNNGPALASMEECRALLGLHGEFVDDWPEHPVDDAYEEDDETLDNADDDMV